MKFIILLTLFLYTISASAQSSYVRIQRDPGKKKQIDSCLLAVTYKVKVPKDTISRFYMDNQILEIGSKTARYYSSFAENMDSVKWKLRNIKSTKIDGSYSPRQNLGGNEDGTYEDIFFNYKESGTLTFIKRFVNTDYEYTEPIPSYNWRLEAAYETILGYTCQKATCAFRGREWTAWFTYEIPIQMGPYKFNGLPGLILKIEDNKKIFVYTAIAICHPINKDIYKYDISTKQTSMHEISRLLTLAWKDPRTLLGVHGHTNVVSLVMDKSGKVTKNENPNPSDPYIPPLELE